jgi:hypothetical protein
MKTSWILKKRLANVGNTSCVEMLQSWAFTDLLHASSIKNPHPHCERGFFENKPTNW